MINVTKSVRPNSDVLFPLLEQILDTGIYTNRGPLVKELESRIESFLGSNSCICMVNGTVTLQILVQLFASECEVITTPFSYVATTSSILWQNAVPVFVDINSDNFNVNSELIEAAITPRTRVLLFTHVFGVPCDVENIRKIAEKYGLVVVYDAAHSFGVRLRGQTIMNYGNFASVSFHSTKLFHTVEGGAIFVNDADKYDRVFQAHNFGHHGINDFQIVGINGKMSEFSAAVGLSLISNVSEVIMARKNLYDLYIENLRGVVGFQKISDDVEYNYSYFPVLLKSEQSLLKVMSTLGDNEIYARRYFYPSLNRLQYLISKCTMPISEDIASRILCLPLFPDLKFEEVVAICDIVKHVLKDND
jgi:dTDP-4-amino-4,6-dideoxygalactose transaminase